MSGCDHSESFIDDSEVVGHPACLRVKLICDTCGAKGHGMVEVSDILKTNKISWEEESHFPMPESCEACHCKGDMEWVEAEGDPEKEPWNPAGWLCRACGQIHTPPPSYEETHSYTRNAGTCVGGESE